MPKSLWQAAAEIAASSETIFGKRAVRSATRSLTRVRPRRQTLSADWDNLSYAAQDVLLYMLFISRSVGPKFSLNIAIRSLSSRSRKVAATASCSFFHKGGSSVVGKLEWLVCTRKRGTARLLLLIAFKDSGDYKIHGVAEKKIAALCRVASMADLSSAERCNVLEGFAYAMEHLDQMSNAYRSALNVVRDFTNREDAWSNEFYEELKFLVVTTRDPKLRTLKREFNKRRAP